MKRLFRFPSRTRRDIAADVTDEFAFHIDMRIEDLTREGMTPAAAKAQAMREFGSVEHGTRACVREGRHMERQRWIARWCSEARQDLIYGSRFLARSPGFSAVAVLTLALAIGGNTTIFGLVNALTLKPMPAANPAELVRLHSGQSQTSWPNYVDLRERSSRFTDVAAHASAMLALTTGDSVVRLMGETASTNYLAMIGIPAAMGRTFLPSDTRADIVVLSEHAWRTRFNSDPAVLGRTIRLGGRPFDVIGVMPKGFRGARPPGFVSEFWVPIDPVRSARTLQDRMRPAFEIVARLKPGVEAAEAQAAIIVAARQIRSEHPTLDESFERTEVFPVDGVQGFRGMSSTLAPFFAFVGVLTIVAGFVLLVGCANIAGLLLGRAAARRREIGVRIALGAGRGRIVRQLLTETLLLALVGGAAGVVLAIWLGSALNTLIAGLPVPIELDLALDRRMLLYTLSLSIATALLCGLAPARRATRFDVVPALNRGDVDGRAGGPDRNRARHARSPAERRAPDFRRPIPRHRHGGSADVDGTRGVSRADRGRSARRSRPLGDGQPDHRWILRDAADSARRRT
jgi:macrolide transport system ATP-binding/permease protein